MMAVVLSGAIAGKPAPTVDRILKWVRGQLWELACLR